MGLNRVNLDLRMGLKKLSWLGSFIGGHLEQIQVNGNMMKHVNVHEAYGGKSMWNRSSPSLQIDLYMIIIWLLYDYYMIIIWLLYGSESEATRLAQNPETCFCFVLPPTSESHPDPPFWLTGLKEYDPDQRLLALPGAFDFFATGGSKEAAGHFWASASWGNMLNL